MAAKQKAPTPILRKPKRVKRKKVELRLVVNVPEGLPSAEVRTRVIERLTTGDRLPFDPSEIKASFI